MKPLLFLFLILITDKAFSQNAQSDTITKYRNMHSHVITAKDAYKYVGKIVILKDNLYSCKIVNDSTLVCQMGEETTTPRLTMIFICPVQFRPVDLKFFNTFRKYRMTIYGTVSGSKNAPIIFLRDNNHMTIDDRRY